MKAVMLAAGVGRRLFGDDYNQPPKALIELDGKSLLHRHIENLHALGVDGMTLVVGFRKKEIVAAARAAAQAIGVPDFVQPITNPRYRGGPVISLWTARETLYSGDDILFMDADVLYHPNLLERLIQSPHGNCFLFERDMDEGEDPVKVCIRDGNPVEFGKMIEGDFDLVGEWPGFMRMTPEIATKVGKATEAFIDEARLELTYEEAIRRVVVSEPPGTFGIEDITGIPWIEIDFPEDLELAKTEILPKLANPD